MLYCGSEISVRNTRKAVPWLIWHYFISDLFSLCLCGLLPDFPLYARASTLSPFKKACKNVKALPWWLTVSAFHFRVIMRRYAHSCTSAAAISVGLITQSKMLFTERIIPECPRLSAGNSLQRDEYRLSWENRLCSIFRACSVLSAHISVVQTHQLQLFSTARDQIKNSRDMLLGYRLPWKDDPTVIKWEDV